MAEADEAWLEALYRAHADAIHRYAAQRVGYEEAADVVSDTFVVAWRKRQQIPRDAEQAWLLAWRARRHCAAAGAVRVGTRCTCGC